MGGGRRGGWGTKHNLKWTRCHGVPTRSPFGASILPHRPSKGELKQAQPAPWSCLPQQPIDTPLAVTFLAFSRQYGGTGAVLGGWLVGESHTALHAFGGSAVPWCLPCHATHSHTHTYTHIPLRMLINRTTLTHRRPRSTCPEGLLLTASHVMGYRVISKQYI